MFVLYLSLLLLTEISWSTEGALKFTQRPEKKVYFRKGWDAVLKWDYSADNKTAELQFISWNVGVNPMMFEDGHGKFQFSPAIPQRYVGRVERIKPATLVIKTLTYEDAGSYSCTLQGVPPVSGDTSDVTLVVTGVEPMVHVAEVGDSVAFTCNATGIPGQNFTWMTNETKIDSDARRPIVSITGSSQLTIKNITVADQGFYKCVATIGSHQQEFGSGFLQVLQGIKILCPTSPYRVYIGSLLSIHCPVSGYPVPIVTWQRNGDPLLNGKNNITYTIANVTEKDFGNYTCTATGLYTSLAPCNISVLSEKVDEFDVTPTDGTVDKPAKLVWTRQAGAEYYVVKISGSDVRADVMVGENTYLEFHYHTLVWEAEQKPEQTVIRAEVLAINNNQVIGKTQTYQNLTIKKPIDIEN